MSDLLFQAAIRLAGLLRRSRSGSERVASFAELSARELREYGLRCCAPGSIQDRRISDLRLLDF
jgi:hypothetical protein